MRKKIRVRKHRRKKRSGGSSIVRSHLRQLPKKLRTTEKLEHIDKRKCYKCGKDMVLSECLEANLFEDPDEIEKLWENPNIELFCCYCNHLFKTKYENIKNWGEIKFYGEDPFAYFSQSLFPYELQTIKKHLKRLGKTTDDIDTFYYPQESINKEVLYLSINEEDYYLTQKSGITDYMLYPLWKDFINRQSLANHLKQYYKTKEYDLNEDHEKVLDLLHRSMGIPDKDFKQDYKIIPEILGDLEDRDLIHYTMYGWLLTKDGVKVSNMRRTLEQIDNDPFKFLDEMYGLTSVDSMDIMRFDVDIEALETLPNIFKYTYPESNIEDNIYYMIKF
jgi:hypothetical protein